MKKDFSIIDEEKEYSVAREMGIVFLVGFIIGLIMLVVSLSLVEFFI